MREYSSAEVAELLNITPQRIRRLVKRGWVQPRRNTRGHFRFTFQDLVLLRTARDLEQARVSKRRISHALTALRQRLPAGQPLSAVRIVIEGDQVVVRDGHVSYEPESGQAVLDFSVEDLASRVAPLIRERAAQAAAAADNAVAHYELGLDYELMDAPARAEAAYRRALEMDPSNTSAYINLGRLLHRRGQISEAEDLYRQAIQRDPKNPIAVFNLGVALEDQEHYGEAINAYRKSIAIDSGTADAHYNLARLLEQQGDLRAALRHLNAFRRLTRQKSS